MIRNSRMLWFTDTRYEEIMGGGGDFLEEGSGLMRKPARRFWARFLDMKIENALE